ncbi:Palmitoyl-protein thioesterase 1 [Arthrobotrys musiformis]|uniref:Palmitoyl-protein thioesterase 1 n=1 Tax=Arthrobotrys musiformis TaxID=47236 RepID=A0AAV9WFG8_9PEZI
MVRRTASLCVLLGGTLASLAGAVEPLPLVIWHGLGDTYDSPGLQSVADLYTSIYPGASTHIIHLADDGGGDRKASYFGSLPAQMETVCDQLSANTNLTTAPHGFHALGFSQGGLFMRGYIEACSFPQVHTLVTFGSPHNGISEFVKCKTTDWLCRTAFGWLNANKWSGWVQSNVVPAQYYRHPSTEEMEKYLDSSGFLADINNERDEKNERYKERLGGLEGGLVMYKFDEDQVIIPKESVWFAEVVEDGEITWLTDRALYKEDWIGLKKLDAEGKLKFLKTGGQHMHITDELLKEVYTKYLWQPEGVVAQEVDGKRFNERLMTLAEPPIPRDEGRKHNGDNQEPLLRVQN